MKQKTLNTAFFDRNCPPVSDAFRHRAMGALSSMAASEEEKAMKHKKYTIVFVMCLVLILLAATALAIGLNRSARYRAVATAREAVTEKYGITADMFGILDLEAANEDGIWTVVFRPAMFNADAIGEYTVVLAGDGKPAASWTHDGVDPAVWSSGGLDAPVWGPRQVESALAIHRERQTQLMEAYEAGVELSLEQWAEIDQLWADTGEQGVDVGVVHVAPGPDDISEADAIALAMQAVRQKYGVSPETLAQYAPSNVSFLKYSEDEEPCYVIWLIYSQEGVVKDGFWIRLYSPSGNIGRCDWSAEPSDRTLPDGPLDAYADAVREFIEEGAFAVLTPAQKADIARRIIDAGYGDYIENKQYEAPGADDITQTEALDIARRALEDTYGFTGQTLALFTPAAALLYEDGQRVWAVDWVYTPDYSNLKDYWWWQWQAEDRLGTYSVKIASDTGAVRETTWSLSEMRGDTVYTERTWGQAEAYDADILRFAQALFAECEPILEKNEYSIDAPDVSLEDGAAYDQLYRDAGFDRERYYRGLPGEGDLTQQMALSIARATLGEQFQVSGARMDAGVVYPSFSVADPEQAMWIINIRMNDDGRQDDYAVFIDAKTGEVLDIGYIGAANG